MERITKFFKFFVPALVALVAILFLIVTVVGLPIWDLLATVCSIAVYHQHGPFYWVMLFLTVILGIMFAAFSVAVYHELKK